MQITISTMLISRTTAPMMISSGFMESLLSCVLGDTEQRRVSGASLILEDRSKLTLTGVTDVDCFDERMINLFTGLGELTIKGRNLHINDVSVETGDMTITGDIWLLQYGEKDRRGPLSLLGKLFR